jgi:hypothetical protein
MLEVEGFVKAGRPKGRSYWSDPPTEFDFGPYRVESRVTIPTGVPRRGVGSKTWLDVVDPGSGSRLACEFDRVGTPIGFELMHGIAGQVGGDPFLVRRAGGPRLRRKHRVVHVSGAVDLRIGYEHRRSVIRAGDGGRVLWTSSSGGLLSPSASHREAAVICILVVNAVDQSSSLLRFLPFL